MTLDELVVLADAWSKATEKYHGHSVGVLLDAGGDMADAIRDMADKVCVGRLSPSLQKSSAVVSIPVDNPNARVYLGRMANIYRIEAVVDGMWHWFAGVEQDGPLRGATKWATTDDRAESFHSKADAARVARRLGGTTFIRQREVSIAS